MIFTVTTKDATVTLDPMTAFHAHVIGVLERAADMCQVSLVISCGREDHPPEDPHTKGYALDIRVPAPANPAKIIALLSFLRSTLGSLFTVLYETPVQPVEPQLQAIATVNPGATAPHFHIQPVKGTIWPPLAPVLTTDQGSIMPLLLGWLLLLQLPFALTLDMSINLGHVITIGSLIATGVWANMQAKARQTLLLDTFAETLQKHENRLDEHDRRLQDHGENIASLRGERRRSAHA